MYNILMHICCLFCLVYNIKGLPMLVSHCCDTSLSRYSIVVAPTYYDTAMFLCSYFPLYMCIYYYSVYAFNKFFSAFISIYHI